MTDAYNLDITSRLLQLLTYIQCFKAITFAPFCLVLETLPSYQHEQALLIRRQ